MQTIVITGSNGFLAQHLCNYFNQNCTDYFVYGIVRDINKNLYLKDEHCFAVDITNKTAVDAIVAQLQPHIIVHAAAISKPNDCMLQPTACLENNVMATSYLVDAAKKCNAKFVYISTDFIYGDDGPHTEESLPNPLNFYGESKLLAEKIVRQSGLWHSIVRPVLIYGQSHSSMKPSFLHWVKNNLEKNASISVVNDQLRTPTYVYDICYAIATILRKNIEGSFGIAGAEILTPYQIAIAVAKHFNYNTSLIVPVTAETFTEPVKRAKKGGLLCGKASRLLNFSPTPLQDGIIKTFGL